MNKIFKRLGAMVALAALSLNALVVTACGHTHTPGAAVKENEVQATCTKGGSYDEVVYCGECHEEISRTPKTTEKTAHTPGTATRENVTNASCSKEGGYDEVIKCTVCDGEISRTHKTVERTEHTPAAAVKENEEKATCTEKGSYDEVVKCSECGEELSRTPQTTNALGHDFAKSYSSNGAQHWFSCSRCNEKSELANHTPGPAATATTAQTCTVCDYVLQAPLGHVHAESLTAVPALPADCETDGNSAYYVCSCGKWFEDEGALKEIENHESVVLKATGHSYSKTWSSDESEHWHEASCKHSELTSERGAHEYGEATVTGGVETRACKTCGYQIERYVGAAAEYLVKHEEGKRVTYTFEAECTNLGGKEGPGYSGTSGGSPKGMILNGTDAGASNGGVVSFLYQKGMSVNFVIVSDRDVEDAELTVRLGAEWIDMLINPKSYGIRVDPVGELDVVPVEEGGAWGAWDEQFLDYYTDDEFNGYWVESWECGEIHIDATKTQPDITGLNDFKITMKLKLQKGINSISFITLNSEAQMGTMKACAPVIDAIKITTDAQLGLYCPMNNGYGKKNAVIEG